MKITKILQRIAIALIATLFACLFRKYFLSSLENKVVWLTFYPAVTVAALFGGIFSGILTSLFAIFIVLFYWQFLSELPFIVQSNDWLSLFVFFFNCSLISGLAEYSLYQKRKAQKAKYLAEHANKAKSTFLANMSHELRTPLNAILGFTRLMQLNDSIPQAEKDNLELINKSGEHLLNLINNVLDISKIEAGHITTEKNDFNLPNTIYDIVLLMSQRAEAKGLYLEYSLENEIPKYINSDELKLKQILLNLLGNAIKFTRQGYIKFKVKYNENTLHLIVEDTGIGILHENLHRIFEPFEQIGNSSETKGTGLGLAITKQFVDLLNGKINVKSEINKGSIFTVELPMEIVTEISNKTAIFKHVKSLSPTEPRYKILIVEDQEENWVLLKRILNHIGIEVQVATNGAIGIEYFQAFCPDLIFMDIRMPVLDGIEATKRIRQLENGKKVKIIGLSAHVFHEEVQKIRASGMDDFIKKPFHFESIYQNLEKHLGAKFEYYVTTQEENNQVVALNEELLNKLDKQILIELRDYIKNLENEKIMELMSRISEKNKEIAEIVTNYISHYKLTEIYRLLCKIT